MATTGLTQTQRDRIERNKKRALQLRESHTQEISSDTSSSGNSKRNENKTSMRQAKRMIDTGGGFLLEEDSEPSAKKSTTILHYPGPIVDPVAKFCDECGKDFLGSYLHTHFAALVCDNCRDVKEKHRLITKSEAKKQYLLKDADIDIREPALNYLLKKNPHNERWGEMKLFLESQVAERARDVWQTDEKLDEAHEQRAVNKEKLKQRQFDRKMKQLRMSARSSLFKKNWDTHTHIFGDEKCVNKDEDIYSKTCNSCGHSVTFEKI